ncbi:Large ribosomal subunit protein uL18z [Cardamine amara subsp. amara]|uniref:Large ribosomal subunit protein uL18z n=1 Tax=Cardamine amara subsp. amara TaxID=228776 RepID=A0ABD1AYZ0_CARAN
MQGCCVTGPYLLRHSPRFAGINKEGKQLEAEFHRNYIHGGHLLIFLPESICISQEEYVSIFRTTEKYQSHFSDYLNKGPSRRSYVELYICNIRAPETRL